MLAVVACGGVPSMAELKARHESGLHPPGARLVAHDEHDTEQTVDGPVVAIVGDVFASDADADEVYAYYDAALPKHEYVRDDGDLSNIRLRQTRTDSSMV